MVLRKDGNLSSFYLNDIAFLRVIVIFEFTAVLVRFEV